MCKSLWSEDGNSSQVGVMLGEETLDLPTCPQAGRPLARRWLAPLISLAYLHNACWVLVGELEGFCWIKDRFEDFLGAFHMPGARLVLRSLFSLLLPSGKI